ncbi:Aryl-phospho-beta-D-glucosidase BglC, GH1 family [Abditibacterium utsteinense]|uniref:Aryl-phospho-beta-D-glucosidase BglC, GH1 family n=1 Tax=Abditibacterium utsteinense TaxID=1960156 RepID=A0A2S8SR14_9BACT|nr:glycoside hydrolase family 5 protein [Abditibacterium utsteinense]PQV63189.1 Aryl-phospho-beta-D-glucosidase BglC, GH1 family [Abditibacterium utsteinense]
MRFIALSSLCLVRLGLLSLALFGSSVLAQAAPSQLHTQGRDILDERNRVVTLRGVNLPSLEWKSAGDYVLQSTKVLLESWKANFIRLPLSQDRWFGRAPEQNDGGAAYRQLIDDTVQLISAKNAHVLLDLHWSNAGVWGQNIGQHKMPDVNSEIFWLMVADKYKNHPAVLFDLYNEPHDVSWEIWKSGGEISEIQTTKNGDAPETTRELKYQTPGMQHLVDVVRATGAKNPIVIGGLDWAYDLTGVLQGGAISDPKGNGIIYSTHIYTWKGDSPAQWNEKAGDLGKTLPLLIGEFGAEPGERGGEDPNTWVPKMLKYIADNRFSYAAWCFHTGATPRIIADWNYTPTPYFGAYVKQALAQAAR